MESFTPKVTYAKNVVNDNFISDPKGVINNKLAENVNVKEVLGSDNPTSPTGISLPKNKFVKVGFGENVVVNKSGTDIELQAFKSDVQTANFEISATATYDDGTTSTKSLEREYTSGNGKSTLLDIDDFNVDAVFTDSISNKEIEFVSVNTLKITGTGTEGTSDGFEVYEVKSNHSVGKEIILDTRIFLREKDTLTGRVENSEGEDISGEIEDVANNTLSGNSGLTPRQAGEIVETYGLYGSALIAGATAFIAGASFPAVVGAGIAAAGFSFITGYGVGEIADYINVLYNEAGIAQVNQAIEQINDNNTLNDVNNPLL